MTITIRVVDGNDQPLSGRRVRLGFTGWDRGMSDDEYTDRCGEAAFDSSPGSGSVYVNGHEVWSGSLRGTVTVQG